MGHHVTLRPPRIEGMGSVTNNSNNHTSDQTGKKSAMSNSELPLRPAARVPDDVHDAAARPQCWECRRRRLVCDGTQPVCTKCRAARIVCPGFADKKPLTWLAPGQVLSRSRKRKGARKAPGCKGKVTKAPDSTSEDSGSDKTDGTDEMDELQLISVPGPVELRPEAADVFEAMLYFNDCIYPDLVAHQLGPNRFSFPMSVLENVPAVIVHTLVSVCISHRIMKTAPEDLGQNQLVKPMWPRLYRHRDIAIRAINKLVGNEKSRKRMVTVVSVYTLLFAMLQQSFKPSWRTHAEGFMSLIEYHGTFHHVLRNVPDMELCLMALWLVGTFANTTTPPNKQVHLTTPSESLRLATDFYTETYYPSISLPPVLLTAIIRINTLRTAPPSPETTTAATNLLAEIQSFSPDTWCSTPAHQPLHSDWLLLSRAFHASTALYAILSLQSSGALPISGDPELDLARTRHARKLFALLEDAVAAPRVRKRMGWPLIVAGVEAAGGKAGWAVKGWIAARLGEMGKEQGCAPPLVARGVLEGFWRRGGGRWDECFGEAMVLVL